MIVTEDDVSKALDYLGQDPHPLALARKDMADAENASKAAFARAFLASKGSSADARKMDAEIDPEYVTAKACEGTAIMDLERHRARVKSAEMICEIWRTEQANVRAAEKIR